MDKNQAKKTIQDYQQSFIPTTAELALFRSSFERDGQDLDLPQKDKSPFLVIGVFDPSISLRGPLAAFVSGQEAQEYAEKANFVRSRAGLGDLVCKGMRLTASRVLDEKKAGYQFQLHFNNEVL